MDVRRTLPSPTEGPGQFFSWLISFNNPADLYRDHVYFVVSELVVFGMFLTAVLSVAIEHGSKHRYYLATVVLSGLALECIPIVNPPAEVWWYEQGVVVLIGRMPLSILFLYGLYGYIAWNAAHQNNVPLLAEFPVVAFYGLLFLLPVEPQTGRLHFWTWHTSDPLVRDKIFGVSFMEFFIMSVKAGYCALTFRLLWDRLVEQKTGRFRCLLPLFCCLLSPTVAIVLTAATLRLVRFLLHEQLGITHEGTALAYLLAFVIPTWSVCSREQATVDWKKVFQNTGFLLAITPCTGAILSAIFIRPELVRSVTVHQKLGPCNETETYNYFYFFDTHQRGFICAKDHMNCTECPGDFDFHCLSEEEKAMVLNSTSQWYPICGRPIPNRTDFCFKIWMLSILSLWFITRTFRCSRRETPTFYAVTLISRLKAFIDHRRSKTQHFQLEVVDKM